MVDRPCVSGSDDEPDVLVEAPRGHGDKTMEPLARVYGEEKQNRESYLKHTIPGVIGNTQADNLKAGLQDIFKSLHSGDTLFFIYLIALMIPFAIYQGHGGYDHSGQRNNTLKVWHDTRLRVSDLNNLFNKVSPGVKIVFFFPQCFSGAFADLMYENPAKRAGLNKQNRCGFLSQRYDRPAEGCTASINSSDYRDYSTYFFAALDGETRNGEPLAGNPDANGDGVVTFREAHLYALKYGDSTDLSRSTSEIFLERWKPWYAWWVATRKPGDDDYSKVAKVLEKRTGLENEIESFFQHPLAQRRAEIQRQMIKLEQEQERLESEEKGLQKKIRYSIEDRWPQLGYPHTNNYLKLMQRQRDVVNRVVRMNPHFQQLAIAQTRLVSIENELLSLKRKDVQLEKLKRMRKLSRISSLFERSANARDRGAYERLLTCEQSVLH